MKPVAFAVYAPTVGMVEECAERSSTVLLRRFAGAQQFRLTDGDGTWLEQTILAWAGANHPTMSDSPREQQIDLWTAAGDLIGIEIGARAPGQAEALELVEEVVIRQAARRAEIYLVLGADEQAQTVQATQIAAVEEDERLRDLRRERNVRPRWLDWDETDDDSR